MRNEVQENSEELEAGRRIDSMDRRSAGQRDKTLALEKACVGKAFLRSSLGDRPQLPPGNPASKWITTKVLDI